MGTYFYWLERGLPVVLVRTGHSRVRPTPQGVAGHGPGGGVGGVATVVAAAVCRLDGGVR